MDSLVFFINHGLRAKIIQSKNKVISFIYKIKEILFLNKEYIYNKTQEDIVTRENIDLKFSILFGFITTFIIFQKSARVKIQKKTSINHINHIRPNLEKDNNQSIETINNKAVNFTEKANQAIIHTINIYIRLIFLSECFDKKRYLNKTKSHITVIKNNHSSTFKSFCV
ncbi:MAG: hypothetical protein P1U46_02790 [Patescibacteria group bacterium]|nr:hypothetical protein [Patescibacteria group bacterium]